VQLKSVDAFINKIKFPDDNIGVLGFWEQYVTERNNVMVMKVDVEVKRTYQKVGRIEAFEDGNEEVRKCDAD